MTARPNLWHDEDGWIPHHVSRQPVGDDVKVRVQFRSGTITKYVYKADQIIWEQRGDHPFDVVAYRLEAADE